MALCRICLIGDIRLLDLSRSHLEIYGKLTDTELNIKTEYDMPSTVCYVCHRQLQRFHMFSEMARKSNRILQDLLQNGSKVTHNALIVQPCNVLNLSLTKPEHLAIGDFTDALSISTAAVEDGQIIENDEEKEGIIKLDEALQLGGTRKLEEVQIEEPKLEESLLLCNIKLEQVEIEEPKLEELEGTLKLEEVSPNYVQINHDTNQTDNINTHSCLSEKHLQFRNQEKSNMCDICNTTFLSSYYLKAHIQTHSGEQRFSCNQCNKRFRSTRDLERHLAIHTGEKPISCDRCDKKFQTTYHLNRHMLIHSGEKPYACNICHKRFATNCTLKKHNMKTHNSKTNKILKTIICNICNVQLRNKICLKSHMETHNLQNECGQSCTSLRMLRCHVQSHYREKSYPCS